ncbi:MAG: ferredoxin [Chloroflexi bacterium]|nr:ferredoxin [Chloroflexota bacterium]
MKARVDKNVCIGTANCVAIAPEVFQLDNHGLSEVVDPNAGTDDLLREAAEECPVQAIILEDDSGKQIYP